MYYYSQASTLFAPFVLRALRTFSKRTGIESVMRKFSLLFAIFVVIAAATSASAANWYVSKAATGSNNGTSWTNAWTDFNNINFSTVACGDTIWVAGGTPYSGSMNINKTCTAGSPLLIRRVLASDSVPVASAGWNSSFDSQVVNNNGTVTWSGGGYVTIDGRVGDAATSVPYGMRWAYSGNSVTAFSNTGTTINNMAISHIELWGPSCASTGTVCSGSTWGVNLNQGQDNNTLIDHCWIHRFAEVIRPYKTTGMTIQYSYIGEDVRVTTGDHEDLIYASDPVTNLTLIGNRWYSSGNDGIFMDNGGMSGLVAYNNIFFHNGGWQISFGKTGTCGPYQLYNNIFESDGTGSDGSGNEYSYTWIGTGGCTIASGSAFANNIFYNTSPDSGGLKSFESYNAATPSNGGTPPSCTGCFQFSLASPISSFTGWVNMYPSGSTSATVVTADFHLTSSGQTLFKAKGTNLTSLCSTYPGLCTDLDGNARPSSGSWTLGPYEYAGTQANAPGAPSNLAAIVN